MPLGFRSRLFLILALFALVPSVVLTVAWGTATNRVLPRMTGAAAWDSAASSGARAVQTALQAPGSDAARAELERHQQELSSSVTQARRFEYLARRTGPALLAVMLILLALLTYLASRIAGHLSRQMSRPLDELVGWTERIAHGEALPAHTASRGAPEFGVLRERMRAMAAELAQGREAAIAAERLEAFRESARQVAHELKNPLTPIRFAIARLRREAPPQLTGTLDVLSTESERLEAMARSFAQFGRLPEGPMAALDLGDIAREAARTTAPPGTALQIETEPGLPLVEGQHDALHRAIANVLINAVEASGESPRVVVRVGRRGERAVVVAVRDHGCGIAPDRLPRIWEPYVTDKTAGTGLGLAIVKQTVMAHGGHVEAESTPGEWTEIRMVFPALPATDGAQTHERS
ncbi:MAG: HAMP domain-containing histidine kinase [Gemmatimonadetes bacterium]|nr:HAMP domain-containing histidine kinase [Gemmatimonadota bacterium]